MAPAIVAIAVAVAVAVFVFVVTFPFLELCSQTHEVSVLALHTSSGLPITIMKPPKVLMIVNTTAALFSGF